MEFGSAGPDGDERVRLVTALTAASQMSTNGNETAGIVLFFSFLYDDGFR